MQVPLSVLFLSFVLLFKSDSESDYSNMDFWAAHPEKEDFADVVPTNSTWQDNQTEAQADVFFIHPTTFYRRYRSNGPLNDKALNRFTDKHSIRMHASVYNGSARVYAPRYRQAALYNFFKRDTEKSRRAFDLAYQDIKTAFEYYLKHDNEGRPIIIAGHSQGSMHGRRLLLEFFENKPLQEQLVSAYLIGHSISNASFASIGTCQNPKDVNCVISYNSFGKNSKAKLDRYTNAICVNPVSWNTDEVYVNANEHPGGVGKDFDGIDENLLGCKCENGVLWIEGLKKNNYPMLMNKNFHLAEYQLFYASIRQNVKERVSSFLSSK